MVISCHPRAGPRLGSGPLHESTVLDLQSSTRRSRHEAARESRDAEDAMTTRLSRRPIKFSTPGAERRSPQHRKTGQGCTHRLVGVSPLKAYQSRNVLIFECSVIYEPLRSSLRGAEAVDARMLGHSRSWRSAASPVLPLSTGREEVEGLGGATAVRFVLVTASGSTKQSTKQLAHQAPAKQEVARNPNLGDARSPHVTRVDSGAGHAAPEDPHVERGTGRLVRGFVCGPGDGSGVPGPRRRPRQDGL